MHMKIWNGSIDHTKMNKAEYEIKVGGARIKGTLTYCPDGSFTASAAMNKLPIGSGTVKLKLEDNARKKYEVRDIPITLGN